MDAIVVIKVIGLEEFKQLFIDHQQRVSKIEIDRLRGLITDKSAVSEFIQASMELEVAAHKIVK